MMPTLVFSMSSIPTAAARVFRHEVMILFSNSGRLQLFMSLIFKKLSEAQLEKVRNAEAVTESLSLRLLDRRTGSRANFG